MKQLFKNNNPTSIFFTNESSFDDIFEWVQESVMFSEDNIFNLNEQRSCSVSNSVSEDMVISGDKDRLVIAIKDVVPVTIKNVIKKKAISSNTVSSISKD